MKRILLLFIYLLTFFSGFANIQNNTTSKANKKINPIDPSYKAIDSVIIEYFDAVGVKNHIITFDRNSITVKSDDDPIKTITNSDTVKMVIKYVESLFISGSKKTEIGRSYLGSISYGSTDIITIRLFMNEKNYLTHTIYFYPSSSHVDYSKTFLNFDRLLMEIIGYHKS